MSLDILNSLVTVTIVDYDEEYQCMSTYIHVCLYMCRTIQNVIGMNNQLFLSLFNIHL